MSDNPVRVTLVTGASRVIEAAIRLARDSFHVGVDLVGGTCDAQSSLERLGQPSDIASAISFLAGPEGRRVNGQTVVVSGAFA